MQVQILWHCIWFTPQLIRWRAASVRSILTTWPDCVYFGRLILKTGQNQIYLPVSTFCTHAKSIFSVICREIPFFSTSGELSEPKRVNKSLECLLNNKISSDAFFEDKLMNMKQKNLGRYQRGWRCGIMLGVRIFSSRKTLRCLEKWYSYTKLNFKFARTFRRSSHTGSLYPCTNRYLLVNKHYQSPHLLQNPFIILPHFAKYPDIPIECYTKPLSVLRKR